MLEVEKVGPNEEQAGEEEEANRFLIACAPGKESDEGDKEEEEPNMLMSLGGRGMFFAFLADDEEDVAVLVEDDVKLLWGVVGRRQEILKDRGTTKAEGQDLGSLSLS